MIHDRSYNTCLIALNILAEATEVHPHLAGVLLEKMALRVASFNEKLQWVDGGGTRQTGPGIQPNSK